MIDLDGIWYRVETRWFASVDDFDEVDYHGQEVVYKYTVVRRTPKGVWLRSEFGEEFFVRGTATKQKAVPTMELARQDEIARRKRHVRGCERRLKDAQHLLAYAQRKAGLEGFSG